MTFNSSQAAQNYINTAINPNGLDPNCQVTGHNLGVQYTTTQSQSPSANNVTVFIALNGSKLGSLLFTINATGFTRQSTFNGNQSQEFQLVNIVADENVTLTSSILVPSGDSATASFYLIVDGTIIQAQQYSGDNTRTYSWTV